MPALRCSALALAVLAAVSGPLLACPSGLDGAAAEAALAAAGEDSEPAPRGAANGSFETSASLLTVTDAYAFPGVSALGEPGVVIVAVSNSGFERAVIDRYWDRRYVLENFFKDADSALVYFEFDPDGRYRGLSYYFGPGDGCGYCSGGVESTVRRDGERLVGKLTQLDRGDSSAGSGGRQFEIELDVAIASDDHGVAQGKGGGAPGAAWLAYHEALAADDAAALRNLLSAERRANWDGAAASGDSDGFLAFLHSGHPRSARVTEAFVRDGQALVLLEGRGDEGRLRGEAFLVLEKNEGGEAGLWRFEEETLQPVYD